MCGPVSSSRCHRSERASLCASRPLDIRLQIRIDRAQTQRGGSADLCVRPLDIGPKPRVEGDQNQRGLLLGSYYYGYTVMQVKY